MLSDPVSNFGVLYGLFLKIFDKLFRCLLARDERKEQRGRMKLENGSLDQWQ